MSRRGKKRKEEDEEQKVADGEQDNLSSDEIREEIATMWEVIDTFVIDASLCKMRPLISLVNAVLDTTNLSFSSFNEGIPQYTSILHVRDGEDADDTEGLETTSKHHDVFAKVSKLNF